MALNDGLLPEQRKDKNGNVSTKWVRPTGEPAVRVRDFPPAAPPASYSDREKTLLKTAEALELFEVHKSLNRLSNRVLEDIASICGGNERRTAFVLRCLDYDEKEEFIDDYLHFVDFLEENESTSSDIWLASVRSLATYSFLPGVKQGEPYLASRRQQGEALIRCANAMETPSVGRSLPSNVLAIQYAESDPLDFIHIPDDRLARFIADHPADTEHIVETMASRRSADVDMLTAVIGNSNRAVSEGIL